MFAPCFGRARYSVSLKYAVVSKTGINKPGSVGAGTYFEIAIPAKSGYTPISIDILGQHVAGYAYILNWDITFTNKFCVNVVQTNNNPATPTNFYATIIYAPIGSPLAAAAF